MASAPKPQERSTFMRLYHSGTSPYVRKVMVLLHEAGRSDDLELVPGSGTPLDPNQATVSHNPLGKVPALERDDGPAIYDSRVITQYLNAWATAGLYPEAPRLWETLTLEATGDGITDAALLMTYEARVRPEDKRYDEWVEAQWTKIARGCAALESRWMSHLHGRLDMGQIAVGCALAYVDLRHGARDWRSANPSLAAWFARFSERPSMVASEPVT